MDIRWVTTKGGDRGETSLCDGTRVPKDDARVQLYGTVDECQALIGVARAHCAHGVIADRLARIEKDLYELMAVLSACKGVENPDLGFLEEVIAEAGGYAPKQFKFTLPGDSKFGAFLHVARAVARRAERMAVSLFRDGLVTNESFVYINRLSDALYSLIVWHDYMSAKAEG